VTHGRGSRNFRPPRPLGRYAVQRRSRSDGFSRSRAPRRTEQVGTRCSRERTDHRKGKSSGPLLALAKSTGTDRGYVPARAQIVAHRTGPEKSPRQPAIRRLRLARVLRCKSAAARARRAVGGWRSFRVTQKTRTIRRSSCSTARRAASESSACRKRLQRPTRDTTTSDRGRALRQQD
jgi:hypothetical protein